MTRLRALLRWLAARGRAWLIVLGALVFLATALYGFGGPYTYGHYGYHAGEYSTRARHTLRQGAVLPGNVPGQTAPVAGSYYIHHPILTHQLVTLTFALLGDHETSVRLAALLACTATLIMLALFIRETFGPTWAAFSVLLFAVVPFDVWYADHIDPGFPALALVLTALLVYHRWLQRGRWADGAGALGAIALSGCFDWNPFLFAVPWGLHIAFIAFTRRGRYLAFVPAFVLAMLLPIGVHALAVTAAHQWYDFLGAYRNRSVPVPVTSLAPVMVIYGRDLFGYPLMAVGLAGFVVALARLVRGTGGARALATVSLVVVTAFYLVVFPVGVVTHAYRLIYLSPAFVLGALEAIAALVAFVETSRRPALARPAGMAVAAALVMATLPTTWQGLRESRAHGGIPNWKTMDPNLPRSLTARQLRDLSRPGDRLYLHGSFPFRMEIGFYLDRDFVPASASTVAALPQAEKNRALFVFAPASLTLRERPLVETLAAQHPYTRLGPYGIIDLRAAGPRTAAYTVTARPPRSAWQAYWLGPYPWPAVEPDLSVRRGPL